MLNKKPLIRNSNANPIHGLVMDDHNQQSFSGDVPVESAPEREIFNGEWLGSFKLKVDGFLNGFEIWNIIGQYGCTDLPCQNGNGDVVIVFGMDRIESP